MYYGDNSSFQFHHSVNATDPDGEGLALVVLPAVFSVKVSAAGDCFMLALHC